MTAVVLKPFCRTWLIIALVLSALSCADRRPNSASRKAHSSAAVFRQEKKPVNRKIYPLSVIYGGAYSSDELNRSRRIDSVVRAHYADFGKNPLVQRNPKDLFMYVSYRKADKIYWTGTRRRIPQGEALLTDGENLARTRCGNRLSFTPKGPTLPEKEVAEDVLNTPETPKMAVPFDAPSLPLTEVSLYIPAEPLPGVLTSVAPSTASAEGASPGGSNVGGGSGGGIGGGAFAPRLIPGIASSTGSAPDSTATTVSPWSGGAVGPPLPTATPIPETGTGTPPPNAVLITPEPATISLLVLSVLLFLACVFRGNIVSLRRFFK